MKDILPTCYDYKKFLNEAVLKFDISINEARKKYGLYTYGQWQKLLKNKSQWQQNYNNGQTASNAKHAKN